MKSVTLVTILSMAFICPDCAKVLSSAVETCAHPTGPLPVQQHVITIYLQTVSPHSPEMLYTPRSYFCCLTWPYSMPPLWDHKMNSGEIISRTHVTLTLPLCLHHLGNVFKPSLKLCFSTARAFPLHTCLPRSCI